MIELSIRILQRKRFVKLNTLESSTVWKVFLVDGFFSLREKGNIKTSDSTDRQPAKGEG